MPISDKPWSDFSESDYEDGNGYCDACLIDLNESGTDKIKGNRKLPVKEPGGSLNRNAVHAAAAVLGGGRGGVKAPPAEKKKAAKKLLRLYDEIGDPPPDSLVRLAK